MRQLLKRIWEFLFPEKTISSSQLLSTREGRRLLGEMIAAKFPGSRQKPIEIDRDLNYVTDSDLSCIECHGYGKVGKKHYAEAGSLIFTMSDEICSACEGTGLSAIAKGVLKETGNDYKVVHCHTCNGNAVVGNVQCAGCKGTGVMKVRKNDNRTIKR